MGADRDRGRRDQGADRQRSLRVGAVVDDLRAVLVAEHDRSVEIHREGTTLGPRPLDEVVTVVQDVEIRRAHAARERAHEHLTRARRGIGE